jgi:hypothetical protein
MALEEQKGFSDNVEQKNRIRRLLKSFFPDRDCCTLVRPLMNENDLQNLDTMELTDLRSEFVEEALALRRKVLNRIKPKTINGQHISGKVFYGLT